MGLRSDTGASALAEKDPSNETLLGAIGRNPVTQTLTIMVMVSILGWTATGGQGVPGNFPLSMPIDDPWWSFITATYGHLDTAHFLSNATLIVVAGGLISLWSSTIRFHAFFIVTGIIASIAQIYVADAFGVSVAVIGTSGSAFALGGYVIGSISAGDSGGATGSGPLAILVLLLAGGITIWFSPQGSAFGSHFVGVLLGLLAGRFHLLRAR